MFGDALKHVMALAYINNLIIDFDTVDARMRILWSKPTAEEHCVDILYIFVFQYFLSFQKNGHFLTLHIYYNIIFYKNQKSSVYPEFLQLLAHFQSLSEMTKAAEVASRISYAGCLIAEAATAAIITSRF